MSVSPNADIFKGDKSMIIKTRDAVTSANFRTSYAQIRDTGEAVNMYVQKITEE